MLAPRTWVGHHGRVLGGTHGSPSPPPIHRGLSSCPHYVEAARADPASTVSPVSQTPIYDQLRDQRITGHAQAAGADPQRVSRSGRHRLPDDAAGVAVTSNGTQRIGGTPLPGRAAPPGPPPASEQGMAAAQGLRAAVAPPAHARQAQTQRASGPAEPCTDHSQAALDAAQQVAVVPTRDRDVDRDKVDTEVRSAAPVGVQ